MVALITLRVCHINLKKKKLKKLNATKVHKYIVELHRNWSSLFLSRLVSTVVMIAARDVSLFWLFFSYWPILPVISRSSRIELPEIVIYNPDTTETLEPPFVEYVQSTNNAYNIDRDAKNIKRQKGESQTGQEEEESQQRGPCFCRNETVGRMCGCCFGMRIDRFNFSQESKIDNN